MKTTQNIEMKIPEGADPIDIADITGNFEKLDTEIAKKANASGGDISAMAVKTLDTIAAEFPVPSAGESSKTFLGKVRKFVQDFNNFKTGILTLGRLVNNGQTTEPGFALDARYGRTLYELYAQLNADLGLQVLDPHSVLTLQNGFQFHQDDGYGVISRCGKNVHLNLLMKNGVGTTNSIICSLPFKPARSEIHFITPYGNETTVEVRTFPSGILYLQQGTIPNGVIDYWPINITYTCQ